MPETMPPLTPDETTLVAHLAAYQRPSVASLMRAYQWLHARLALAQYIAEEAMKEDRQLVLVSAGKETEA